MADKQEYVCLVCGTKINDKQGRGRKALYCSENCREAMKYWGAFQAKLNEANLDGASRKNWRGELFCFSNSL